MKKFYIMLLLLCLGLLGFGQSTEVGVTGGQLSVSLTGAATYTIPIAVPPGINGVAPQISLSYNSQAGNCSAGYGWNITGISTITRIPSTKFHNGNVGTINYNLSDNYALDGQRLIMKEGNNNGYGKNGTVYETENYSNIKVTSYGAVSSSTDIGPDYFVVEYPDGSKAYYGYVLGNESNSRSQVHYAITYWENPQGNRVSYYYTPEISEVLNIKSIKYGAIKNNTPINEINFIYKNRYAPSVQLIAGQQIKDRAVLSDIKITTGGTGFRNYALTHDLSSLHYDRLKTITEKTGDNTKSLNPTVFSYMENQSIFNPQMDWSGTSNSFDISNSSVEIINGDFDGDGDIEFLAPVNFGKQSVSLYKILDNYSVKELATQSNPLFKETNKKFTINSLDNNFKISSKQNICFTNSDNLTIFYNIFKYNDNTKTIDLDYQKTIPNDTQAYPSLSGDFDGDYLTDLISIGEPINGYSQTKFINLDRRLPVNFVSNSGLIERGNFQNINKPGPITGTDIIREGDINGDGKTDIIVFRGSPYNDITAYTLINNVFEKIVRWSQSIPGDIGDTSHYSPVEFPVVIGDFNGDGKSDIFLVALGKILISSGGSYFIEEFLPAFTPPTYPYVSEQIVAFDYNNDGRSDILRIRPSKNQGASSSSVIDIDFYCRNTPEQSIKWFNYHYNRILKANWNDNSFPQDDNKFESILVPLLTRKSKVDPSKTDLAIVGDFRISFFSSNNYSTDQHLVKTFTNGNGVTETVTYSPLKSGNGVYWAGNIKLYPDLTISNSPEFKVVSQVEKQNASEYKKQLFRYYGAVTNVEGLGFLGFGSTVKTNWHNDLSPLISYISRNDISLRGANIENYTVLGLHEPLFDSSNQIPRTITKEDNYTVTGTENLVASQSIVFKPNTWIKPESTFSAKIDADADAGKSINEPVSFITKSLLTYEDKLLSNKVFKIKNISMKQFDGLENISNETKTEYDDYNNPTKISTEVNEASTLRQKSITDITYQNETTPTCIIGRPLTKTQNVTLGNEKMTTEEKYEYNSNQLLSEIQKKGDAGTNYITESRSYDSFGNILKRTLKAGQDSREFNYEYDSTGRFLIKDTDAEKLVTSYVYNPNCTLKSVTNSLGQTTLYQYDSWFKKTKETDYLGNANDFRYVNNSGNTTITKTYADGNVAEETYDDLGRKTKSGAKNSMGTFTYVSYLYDIQDRNYKVSEPYIGTTASQWNETKYDDYGRVTNQNVYTGKTIKTDYSPLITKVDDGTITKTYKKDALGNVVSMFDRASNEIKYTYYANGNLKESDYGGIKTKMLQDGWGRKIELQDPSAGIIKYKYNDFGELTSEENVNGTTTYKLTTAGRLEGKTIKGLKTDSQTTYNYDVNKLLLSSIFKDLTNGTNTITTSYTYDDKKRISNKTETTPFAVFTKDFSYDAFGRLATEGFTAKELKLGKSSTKTVKYSYKNGNQYQITDEANTVLWQINTINARGQLLTAQNGPLTITNVYDGDGYNQQSKFDKTASSTNILSLNTSFNTKTGNLDSRTNTLLAWNESFKYDNLDRLEEYTNTKGILEIQKYDGKGRITQNSLGSYEYVRDNPYQNASITTTPDALTYYTAKPSQIINYNVFKSPVLIDEKNIDKISFDYNDNNRRTAMFYGDLQDDKLKRPYRKYYSGDGTMEIKESTGGVYDFVTYIGGDGYSAPLVFKSDGSGNQKYLYLQRDYQGSIVGIADQAGTVVEKRVFDAWGNIAKVQDGAGNILTGLTVLDRGYTGHEHLQSVGLINMNGRIYDPKLHRFLQPDNNIQDPFNTQNYNRYGYVMNNPLRYTDPSGELWNVFFGYLFTAYVKGAYASGGELNPAKWKSTSFTNIAATAASLGSSTVATNFTNNYLENYNNKPALGASAVGPGDDLHSFVNNSKDYFSERKVVSESLGQDNGGSFSKESLGLSMGILSESKFEGRYYFKETTNTFFDLKNISKFGTYGSNILDLYDIGSGFSKIATATSPQERTDAANSLAFDGFLIGLGRKWPAVGLTIGIGKVISTTDTYKQGMIEGRNKAFIQKNGHPVNHTATIKSDSGMYRECEICPLKFR
ncbi:RHS repeat-associated core domain-containing protein [Flavobacterium sp. 2]|uniref:RHS repeat-associated core domain-containing protein n=1 Tax=Flavobacterium sp. 2 TaxID=308053 RepID=UPI003CEBB1F4